MRKCRKRHSGDILGETISIIYFSLDHILFQNTVQTCTHTCVRYLRGHEEAYSQSTHLVKTLSVTVVPGGTLHKLKRCIPYFYSSVTKNIIEEYHHKGKDVKLLMAMLMFL